MPLEKSLVWEKFMSKSEPVRFKSGLLTEAISAFLNPVKKLGSGFINYYQPGSETEGSQIITNPKH